MSLLQLLSLSTLGAVHTAIGLLALAAGFVSLFRYYAIDSSSVAGRIYLWATSITALTGLGIFRHGNFGSPHILSIVTLLVLALALLAERRRVFGSLSPYAATVGYSLSLLLHFIPSTVESLTRFPLGAPLAADADAPIVLRFIGIWFALFLIGTSLQVLRLRVAMKHSGRTAVIRSPA